MVTNGREQVHIQIYDCGCCPSRPKEPSCKTYGTRWRVFWSVNAIKLKCRDCGRMHTFALMRPDVQMIQFTGLEDIDKDGVV